MSRCPMANKPSRVLRCKSGEKFSGCLPISALVLEAGPRMCGEWRQNVGFGMAGLR